MKKSTIFWALGATVGVIGIILVLLCTSPDLMSRMTEPCRHCSCTHRSKKQVNPEEAPQQAS